MRFSRECVRAPARQRAHRALILGSFVSYAVMINCSADRLLAANHSTVLDEGGLPPNLSAASVFRPYLDRMMRASPTFRRQCERLAAAAPVKVVLGLEELQRRPSFRARTVLQREKGAIVAAHVFLSPSANVVELIAHEVEHVLEQLDGVDLEAQLDSRSAWKREDGAFETLRATEVGHRVAREVSREPKTNASAR